MLDKINLHSVLKKTLCDVSKSKVQVKFKVPEEIYSAASLLSNVK